MENLANDLTSGNLPTRRRAAETLAKSGPTAVRFAPPLVRAAGDDDEIIREWAVAALEELGPPREADLPEIAGLLLRTPADTAYWAATLLGRSGSAAAAFAESLAEALQIRHETALRERIAWALGKMGPAGLAAAAALSETAREAACPPRLARLCREALQSVGSPL